MTRGTSLLPIAAAAMLLLSGVAEANQILTTPDGRRVLLRDDGTYQFLDPYGSPATPQRQPPGGYQGHQQQPMDPYQRYQPPMGQYQPYRPPMGAYQQYQQPTGRHQRYRPPMGAAPAPMAGYLPVAFDEIVEQLNEGETPLVQLDGYLANYGSVDQILLFRTRSTSSANIAIDGSQLPREEREAFFSNCRDLCRVTIQGVLTRGRSAAPYLIAHHLAVER